MKLKVCAATGWLGIFISSFAIAQDSTNNNSFDDLILRTVPAKNLTGMRIHPATNPDEAALRCSVMEPCVMGLSRGFSVGSDLLGVASALVYQPQATAGAWTLIDGFVGYQFLDAVEKVFHANGSIGFRQFSYKDSNDNQQKSSSVTFRVNYAQDITQEYTQGLTLAGAFSSNNSIKPETRIYEAKDSEDARRSMKSFYKYSQKYPTIWLSFPADYEVINWKASHIDLPSDLRAYVHAEPFFAQNQFVLPNNAFSWTEQNFGLRSGASLAYESRSDRVSGRFTAYTALGLELATSTHETEQPKAQIGATVELPAREPVSPYLDFGMTWQF